MANNTKFENSVHITGYVGKMPEFKVFESNKRRAKFSIAVSQPVRRGQAPKEPMWLDIEAWDEFCDRVREAQFGKGSLVTVYGAIAPNVYEKTVGDTTVLMQKVKIKLADFEVATAKQTAADPPPTSTTADQEAPPVKVSAPKTAKFKMKQTLSSQKSA